MKIRTIGVEHTPANNANDCFENGKHMDKNGELIECGCDECDSFLTCFPEYLNEKKIW